MIIQSRLFYWLRYNIQQYYHAALSTILNNAYACFEALHMKKIYIAYTGGTIICNLSSYVPSGNE